MKIRLMLALLFVAPIYGISELTYQFEPLMNEQGTSLKVNMAFRADDFGETIIGLPSEWAGQKNLWEDFKDLKVLTPGVQLTNGKEPYYKHLTHKPSELIELSYVVEAPKSQDFCLYKPILKENYLHFLGNSVFVKPMLPAKELNEDIQCLLDFSKVPKGWNIATSFGVNTEHLKVKKPLHVLSESVFLMGPEVRINKIEAQGGPIYCAFQGSFEDETLMDIIHKVVKAERSFWNDYDFPFYLMTFLEAPCRYNGDVNVGGTGLDNSLAIYANKDADLYALKYVIAHEHLHTWIGGKIPTEQPEPTGFWFTEGFTDYYAYLLGYRAGIFSQEEYEGNIEFVKNQYLASPFVNAENKVIVEKFWQDAMAWRLPYVRGFMFARYLNNKIQESTQGKSTLDNFMHDMLANCNESKKAADTNLISTIASTYIPGGIKDDIEKYIINGGTITV